VSVLYGRLVSGYTASSAAFVGPTVLDKRVLNAGNWGSRVVLGVRVVLRNRLQDAAQ
jgi:hypothetical protein